MHEAKMPVLISLMKLQYLSAIVAVTFLNTTMYVYVGNDKLFIVKKGIICMLLFFTYGICNAQFEKDKQLHLGAGVVIGGIGGYTAHKIFKGNPYWTWAGALGSSLSAGLVKEKMDNNEYGGWDNNDILYTALGGLVSGLVLDLLLNKDRRRKGALCSCYASHNGFFTPLDSEILLSLDLNGSGDLVAALQAQRIIKENYNIE